MLLIRYTIHLMVKRTSCEVLTSLFHSRHRQPPRENRPVHRRTIRKDADMEDSSQLHGQARPRRHRHEDKGAPVADHCRRVRGHRPQGLRRHGARGAAQLQDEAW